MSWVGLYEFAFVCFKGRSLDPEFHVVSLVFVEVLGERGDVLLGEIVVEAEAEEVIAALLGLGPAEGDLGQLHEADLLSAVQVTGGVDAAALEQRKSYPNLKHLQFLSVLWSGCHL